MIIANWKCNGGKEMMLSWVKDYDRECDGIDSFVGVAPPLIYYGQLSKENIPFNNVGWGVQDVDYSGGSRTGSVSVDMLVDMKCAFSIVGHSERRELFNEDNELIKKKIENLNNKIMILLCVGESKEENKKGITKDILKDQLEVIKNLELDSGLTPEPKDINEIHKYIKDVVQSNSANNLSPTVLYGGSVTDKNAGSFFNEEFVDGALVGGASLDGTTFAKIVNIFNKTKEL
jgi:triosephosphate isomerase